jgi:hypothetical protein
MKPVSFRASGLAGSIVPCAVARRDFSVAKRSPSPQALDCELERFQVSVARA